jgi:uncharacterized protein (TIGR02099 family)
MKTLTPLSYQLLRIWSVLTRWMLGGVILLWLVLLLTWGALHWLIVPRINDFRPELEQYASQALGVPVQVGSVTAQSNGWAPSFEVTDVNLLDVQGRVALSLPRILVALSPRSLWRMGFEQLYIDQPKLDVRRASDGNITIGGLDFSSNGAVQTAPLDWFFSQREWVIHDGVVRWSDEMRGVEPIVLQKIGLVVRNQGRRHDLRLDATPPEVWGQSFSWQGNLMHPLLARHPGQWQNWQGQLYAAFERVDLSELRLVADLGVDLRQGMGALRAWAEVDQAKVKQVVADLALSEVNVILGQDLGALVLHQMHGRLGGRVLENGWELSTQDLAFATQDGLHWPGGNVSVLVTHDQNQQLTGGEIKADRLDLAAVAQIVNRLPLDAGLRESVALYAPRGLLDNLQARWQGSLGALQSYSAKGRLSALELAAVSPAPGLQGADIEFDFDQRAGQAKIALNQGRIYAPGLLHDPVLNMAKLQAQARWQVQGEQLALQLDKLTFANADGQGEANIKWQTSDPLKNPARARLPGVLEVQGSLSRAEAKQVYRYLPLALDAQARDYVREAVLDGSASNVKFQVKGEIDELPNQGIFKITAQVREAKLAYVPRSLQEPSELPWPMLSELGGELIFDRLQLQVKNARAKLGPWVQVSAIEAGIADLSQARVSVMADFKGPAAQTLQLVNASPVRDMTAQALAAALVSGSVDGKLNLQLPLDDLNQSRVKGSISLAGNDLQLSPDTPRMKRARGVINFTENGFSLSNVQASLLGGDARLDGGLNLSVQGPQDAGKPELIRINGQATAEGLRQASELGFVARLAHFASGSAAYSASIGLRRGVPQLQINSSLQGLALNLPQPLNKSAETVLPLNLRTALISAATEPLRDRMTLSLGSVLQLMYERDVSKSLPLVVRGTLEVGLDAQESAPLADDSVSANIKLKDFNLDAWRDVLNQVSAADSGVDAIAYLPSVLALRAESLQMGAHQFNHVLVGGGREGGLWRANVLARELNGYIEYLQPSEVAGASRGGRVFARLAKLALAPHAASEVEALLDEQPARIPALDVVVEDFEYSGKRLGRLEVQALNRTGAPTGGLPGVREWRLNKFNLSVPEATLTASGNWAAVGASAAAPAVRAQTRDLRNLRERRRTALNFKLDIADSGALLGRFGMKDVIARGLGKLEGQIGWFGSPLSLDYPSMTGALTVDIESGQFLKADPGIAKLLGVLSLQSLPRRLTLDFRDVFSDGFAFDSVRGNVTIEKGIASTNNLQMKGVNAGVFMEGSADIAQETQDIKVVVVPEINAGTASLLASVVNPLVGLSTFLAQVFLRRPLIESATQEFHVDGTWSDPQVRKVIRPISETIPTEKK